MDNRYRSGPSAVDDILRELKGRDAASEKAGSVDDILKGLKRPVPGAAAPPAAVAPPVAAVPAEKRPHGGQPARSAASGLGGARIAAPAPAAPTGAAPVPGPAAAAPAPRKAAQAPLFESEIAPPPPAPQSAQGAPAPQNTSPPPPQDAAFGRKKPDKLSATIWDIDVDAGRTDAGPRTGKAAALDRVERDKFSGDSELLSWFGGDEGALPTSKKELKKLEKSRKRRAAAEARRLRFGREEPDSPDGDDVKLWEPSAPEEECFAPPAVPSRSLPDLPGPRPPAAGPARGAEPAPANPGFFRAAEAGPRAAAAPRFAEFDAEPQAAAPREVPADAESASRRAAEQAPRPAPRQPTEESPRQATEVPPPQQAVQTPPQAFGPSAQPAPPPAEQAPPQGAEPKPEKSAPRPRHDTKNFDLEEEAAEGHRVPTAAFTQEFGEDGLPIAQSDKSLFVDDMVDERFRSFFGETVSAGRQNEEPTARARSRRKKTRSAILTGEFGKLAEQAGRAQRAEEENVEVTDDLDDYNRPQDAEDIEADIASLRAALTRRTVFTGALGLGLLWLALLHSGLPLPGAAIFEGSPAAFAITYLAFVLAGLLINFTTVVSGLAGLAGEPTADSAPALAGAAALLQGVFLLVNALSETPAAPATLFGAAAALGLAFNALGKRVRAVSILANFQLASAGFDHSAAYVLDNSTELTYSITSGLKEEYPCLLVSRPTGLVKGFLRQSFSLRAADRRAKIVGWVLLGAGLCVGAAAWLIGREPYAAVSAFAAALCLSAPFSSTLVSGIPSLLLQRGATRVGAVVPGWSAIEELGGVNVIMAGSRDVFPPGAVHLKGIKTFEKERIDLAILYAASVLVEGCDTLRDIFLSVIQGKSDMLYKVESLTREPQRGFTAWVQNSRVVIGTREMLQKHGIAPPPIEAELKFVPKGYLPLYLAVSGKLFAMFILGYGPHPEVKETLEGLVRSGVSLLIDSSDMNVTGELVEQVYNLPAGAVKVLSRRELDLLEPLTAYLPESNGVMTHIGTFFSFIGGMRAAAACASSEKMANIVGIASAGLALALSVLLAFSGGLSILSLPVVLAYQLGWTLLVSALPAARRY